jgi:hypothetical protein
MNKKMSAIGGNMARVQMILPALLISAAAGVPAHAGLIIDPTFDSTITSQTGAAGIESTIDGAISLFENTYTNNITVSIEFYATTTGLGESQVGFTYNQPYQAFYNALVTTNANPAAIAGLTANNGNNANNPVNGTQTINVKSANERAVGLAGAPLCNVIASGKPADPLTCSGTAGGTGAIDGLIGLNTGITYPPNANNGSNYGLLATTEHEIDEVLGLGSALPNCNSNPPVTDPPTTPCTSASASNPAPEDLFRYVGNAEFAPLTENCSDLSAQAYLSYSGAADITNMNTACNGGDWGDWGGNSSAQVQDAFTGPGAQPTYGPSEIAAMSAIGYKLATPEPATWLLMLTSLAVLAGCAIRRSSVRAGK